MSLKAMLWALHDAPVDDPTSVLVLLSLADSANDDGSGAWPAVSTLADRARCSERTVQRHLRTLEADKVIKVVAPATRYRPTEYAMNLRLRRGAILTPLPLEGVTPVTGMGDTGVTAGVTQVSPEQSMNSPEPKNNPAASRRAADPLKDEAHKIVKDWWDGLDVKPAGQRAWFACTSSVHAMLKAGHAADVVAQALRTAGTPVTVARLELELRKGKQRREVLPDWSDGVGF